MRNNEHKKTPVNQIGGTNPFSEAKGFLSYFGYWHKYSILNWDFETLSSKITPGMLQFSMNIATYNKKCI